MGGRSNLWPLPSEELVHTLFVRSHPIYLLPWD